jgi:hypothetical protein
LQAAVAVLLLINGGCLLAAVGAAAGGAATVGYVYYKNRLYHDFPTSLGDGQAAVRAALADLGFVVAREKPGKGEVEVTTHSGDGTQVIILLTMIPSQIPAETPMTRISVQVGFSGDEQISARILDQVNAHLTPPAQVSGSAAGAPRPVLGPPVPETKEPTLAATPAPPGATPVSKKP